MKRLRAFVVLACVLAAPAAGFGQDKCFDSNGVSIRYIERGAGDAVVLLQQASERERECISRTLIYRLAPPNEPKPTEDVIKARSTACFADPDEDRFAVAALVRSRRDSVIRPADAAAVRVPTFGIVGSLDPNQSNLQELSKLRPDMKLLVVDGATHAGGRGILTRPEFLTALREFLASYTEPRSTK